MGGVAVVVDAAAVVLVELVGWVVVVPAVLVVAAGRRVVVGASASLTHPTVPSKTAQSADERALRIPTPPAKDTVRRPPGVRSGVSLSPLGRHCLTRCSVQGGSNRLLNLEVARQDGQVAPGQTLL